MDFSLTEAQRELGALTRRIVTDHCTPERLREVEAKGDRFDPRLWTELGKAGLLDPALTLPEQCAVLIELGRAVAPVPYVATVVTAQAVLSRYGTEAQRSAWAGQVLAASAVPATLANGALDGLLPTVAAAPYASAILVPAEEKLFLVLPDDEGVTIERQRIVDGDNEGLVSLSGVRVPSERVIDAPGAASWMRLCGLVGLCALQTGVTSRALELTAAYAGERVQFGRPIGTFQAVGQRLADAYIDAEAIRLTMWQAAWRLGEGLPCETEVSTAKFWAADGGHRIAHAAVHIHGGVGIDVDHGLHRYFVAAKRNEFALGGATAHLVQLGQALAELD
jgi:alkylation response protein AidB-like acyl-CoA dehydrogenase